MFSKMKRVKISLAGVGLTLPTKPLSVIAITKTTSIKKVKWQ